MKKAKPKKVYVLMVSRVFPTYHPRKGEDTNFIQYIIEERKEHTLRGNYAEWKRKADAVNAGKAIISLRVWTGKPYASKQSEFAILDSVEVQKAHVYQIARQNEWFSGNNLTKIFIENSIVPLRHPFKFAYRDGLSLPDFQAWFKKTGEDLALIHFGSFKY